MICIVVNLFNFFLKKIKNNTCIGSKSLLFCINFLSQNSIAYRVYIFSIGYKQILAEIR